MSKVIAIGKNGSLSSVRDSDTQEAIDAYCKERNITEEEIRKKGLSIYVIEFNDKHSPYIHLSSNA